MSLSDRGMVLGDEKMGMPGKPEKKSKKRNKDASASGVGLEQADIKAVEEEKLAAVKTRKDRDKAKKETKSAVEREDHDAQRTREVEVAKHSGDSCKDGGKDAQKNVEKKKEKKLKKKRRDEQNALLDTKTITPSSASESWDGGEDVQKDVEKKKDKMLKKKHRDEQNALSDATTISPSSASESWDKEQVVETLGEGSGPNALDQDSGEVARKNVEKKKDKKLKKKRRDEQNALSDTKTIAPSSASESWDNEQAVETLGEGSEPNVVGEARKKRKREKAKKDDQQVDVVAEVNEGGVSSTIEEREKGKTDNGNIRKKKKAKVGHASEDPALEKNEKRVRFSGHVQVFPLSSDPSDEKDEVEEENLVRGKRFSDEEDEIVKDAVYKYIEVHNLGEEGLQKVLNSKSNPEVKGCWKEIGSCIPYRPYAAVYYRAQVLFRRGEKRKWTEEEYEMVRKFQEEHGPNWKVLADELGKHRFHVKDTWRRIKLTNRKKGYWTQEEYQNLFDLVNTDLQLKVSEEKKSKHGMLRDNICWGAISEKLSTRTDATCCLKWYNQLTSPMVASGVWADTDDYRLVDALFELDASCIEDVDWDNLLSHRPAEICRKRWNQMVLHIGQHGNKSFAEQVEVLAKRYRPELVETREAWDEKPVVP